MMQLNDELTELGHAIGGETFAFVLRGSSPDFRMSPIIRVVGYQNHRSSNIRRCVTARWSRDSGTITCAGDAHSAASVTK